MLAQYETGAAVLQASNLELAERLLQAEQRVHSLEGRLAEQQAEASAAAQAAEAAQQRHMGQLEELGAKMEAVLASRLALQAQAEAAAAERQQLVDAAQAVAAEAWRQQQEAAAEAAQQQREAAAQAAQLLERIDELQARPPIHLSLLVSYEAEWRAEVVRAAALEARAAEAQVQLAALHRQQRREAAR